MTAVLSCLRDHANDMGSLRVSFRVFGVLGER